VLWFQPTTHTFYVWHFNCCLCTLEMLWATQNVWAGSKACLGFKKTSWLPNKYHVSPPMEFDTIDCFLVPRVFVTDFYHESSGMLITSKT
jgi:hypothetical protein